MVIYRQIDLDRSNTLSSHTHTHTHFVAHHVPKKSYHKLFIPSKKKKWKRQWFCYGLLSWRNGKRRTKTKFALNFHRFWIDRCKTLPFISSAPEKRTPEKIRHSIVPGVFLAGRDEYFFISSLQSIVPRYYNIKFNNCAQ